MKYTHLSLKAMIGISSVALFGMVAHRYVAAATDLPDAGSLLRQLIPPLPTESLPGKPNLTMEPDQEPKQISGNAFLVNGFIITGNTLFDTPTLEALIADHIAKTLSLPQLEQLTMRITNYYQSKGYLLTRAIIPAQAVTSGIVRIDVIEAQFGEIKLNNSSRVNNRLLQSILSPLKSGQPVRVKEIERALLLLSDVPGLEVDAALKPGSENKTADLLIITMPGSAASGSVALDNFGSTYTGRSRLSIAANLFNPLYTGDTLTVNGLSTGRGMQYGRVVYEALIKGNGQLLGGSYSLLNYALGAQLKALLATGSAQVGSLWVRQPLARSRDINVFLQIQLDTSQLSDRIDSTGLQTSRRASNLIVGLSGNYRDAFLSGGISTYNVSGTDGQIKFHDMATRLADAASAKTEGNFFKLNASFSRQQALVSGDTLLFSVYGQWTGANLDSLQKMSVGGANSVRAYDIGALSGDRGYFASIEYQHNMGNIWGGQWQTIAFIDHANMTVNSNPWAFEKNRAILNGAGVEFTWSGSNQWNAKMYIASPFGVVSELVRNSHGTRVWVEFNRRF
jgi:hemolysin activation/secretion protein